MQAPMQAETFASVMAVLVVYERSLQEAKPWQTLRRWLEGSADGRGEPRLHRVFIYDNSAQSRAKPPADLERCDYVHNPGNGGTAAAYRAALSVARERGIDWLLLLDHDTQLPEDFLDRSAVAARLATEVDAPVAVVPWVRHGVGRIVSPTLVTRMGSFRPLTQRQKPGDCRHLSAIASGSLLRASALENLPPWPKGLWLDYVDHWIFTQLQRNGSRILVSDQVLQHDLSVAAPGKLSATRLRSLLDGEAIFTGLLGLGARAVYPLRLMWRILNLARLNPRLAMTALHWVVAGGPR